MSDDTTATPATIEPAPAPVAAAAAPAEPDPKWIKERLDRERKAWLRDLGVEDPEDAKAAFKAYKEQQEREKSEVQRLTERVTKAETQVSRTTELESAVKIYVESEFSKLSESQRETVIALAGNDPASQLKTLKLLAPTWQSAPAATPAATAPPVDTAPPRNAPADDSNSPPDHKAVYASLKEKNPYEASRYALDHYSDIYGNL
jgi:hypothetical protein